jgi:hypothetical protein
VKPYGPDTAFGVSKKVVMYKNIFWRKVVNAVGFKAREPVFKNWIIEAGGRK